MTSPPLRERVRELLARGLDFNRDDLDELRTALAREPDLDEVHAAREVAYGTLWLLVASGNYRGDLTVGELEGKTREEAAQEIIDGLLDR